MPRSLQRLSLVVQTILSLIECPVCLDTITPPAMQCQNGHLLCVDCRIRAEKCPVCRDRYFPRPALIAEQIQSAITSAFNLCRNEDKVRQKVFARHNRQRQMVKSTLVDLQEHEQQLQHQLVHKSSRANALTANATTNQMNTAAETTEKITPINRKCDRNVRDKLLSVCSSSIRNRTACNKLFTKLSNSKAYSMENLTNVAGSTETTSNNNFNTCQTTIKSAISQFELFDMQQQQHDRALFMESELGQQQQQPSAAAAAAVNPNQFYDSPRNVARNQYFLSTNEYKAHLSNTESDFNLNTNLCCRQMLDNKMKHFSLSSDKDSSKSKENITCVLDSSIAFKCKPMICEASNATVPRAKRLMRMDIFGNNTFDRM